MTYVITDACVDVKDKACMSECPVDCIYEGPRSLYIHPDECIDCGACEAACPTFAIVSEFDLQDPVFLARGHEVFAGVGSPMGAKRHGPLEADHPDVANMKDPTAA